MNLKKLFFIGVCALPLSGLAYAEEKVTPAAQSETTESKVSTSSAGVVKFDDFSKTFWGLDQAEWNRYLMVKEIAKQLGKTPVSSTPPEVLSIFAENESDRRRYAKIFAEKYDLYVKMLLASNRAITAVQAQMYANTPMLDPNAINELRNAPLRTTDRIQYFTNIQKCSECDVMLRKLIRQVRLYGVKLDLFITGDVDDSAIQDFANQSIPAELMADGKITLNRDMGFSAKHNIIAPKPFLSRNGGPLEPHNPEL
jgi:integrating conjugative element protein (TIGR03759 family)